MCVLSALVMRANDAGYLMVTRAFCQSLVSSNVVFYGKKKGKKEENVKKIIK